MLQLPVNKGLNKENICCHYGAGSSHGVKFGILQLPVNKGLNKNNISSVAVVTAPVAALGSSLAFFSCLSTKG
jgi:hypothetical protein